MMDVSRRQFLIGSAATLVAASIPLVSTESVSVAQTLKNFPYRSIFDVTFSAIPGNEPITCNSVTYKMLRRTAEYEGVLYHVAMHPLGLMRWVAAPGSEWIFPEGHIFEFRAEPATVNADLNMLFHIDPPNKGPMEYTEAHWEDIYDTDEFPYDYDEDYEPKVIDRQWIPARWERRRRIISESYSWRGAKLESKGCCALDPRDSDLT